jgi:hypothetical protein
MPHTLIVVHAAGYIRLTTRKRILSLGKQAIKAKEIQASWLNLKNNSSFYEKNKAGVDRINEIIAVRIANISAIVSRWRLISG